MSLFPYFKLKTRPNWILLTWFIAGCFLVICKFYTEHMMCQNEYNILITCMLHYLQFCCIRTGAALIYL